MIPLAGPANKQGRIVADNIAGINSKEEWHTHAVRNKLIGQGLAGSVLRNQIMELFGLHLMMALVQLLHQKF